MEVLPLESIRKMPQINVLFMCYWGFSCFLCRNNFLKSIIFSLSPFPMNLDKSSEFAVNFQACNRSDQMPSVFGFHNHSEPSEYLYRDLEKPESQFSSDLSVTPSEAKGYFDLLFSPHNTMASLTRINQNLQMKLLEQSDSEPEQYFKRKERVRRLEKKEEVQVHMLQEIRCNEPEKHQVISQFMRLFASIKLAINGIRSDYYSSKVFTTLQKISIPDLYRISRTLFDMYRAIMKQPIRDETMLREGSNGEKVDERLVEFLIIPRFLISKDKLLKIADSQELQNNFKFLVANGCLGHYNNEANKKLPEEGHMKYIRDLVQQINGKEKYKRLCSINHGGRFLREHGEEVLYSIFFKPLDCLNLIDQKLKKKINFNDFQREVETWQNERIIFHEKKFEFVDKNNPFQLQMCKYDIIDARSVSKYLFSDNISKSIMHDPIFTKSESNQVFDEEDRQKKSQKVKKFTSLIPTSTSATDIRLGKLRRTFTVQTNNAYS